MLFDMILCSSTLCHTTLFYAILCCTALYHVMLYNVGTDFMILHYLVFNILCCIALLDFVMLCHCSNTISYEATGYYFISSCNILHGNAFYDMLLTGRVLLDMVLYHTVLFRFIFCQIMFHFILIHPAVCTYIYIYTQKYIQK